ncbi:MAG: hypothetical protein KC561_13710 [Myxococcales bacterium]|nr:hypothetical protein [Myxococcales bacterium]
MRTLSLPALLLLGLLILSGLQVRRDIHDQLEVSRWDSNTTVALLPEVVPECLIDGRPTAFLRHLKGTDPSPCAGQWAQVDSWPGGSLYWRSPQLVFVRQ